MAGAAKELAAAVLVNPYDQDGVAEGIRKAIEMPVAERRERYADMIAVLRKNDIHTWRKNFVTALTEENQASNRWTAESD
jgi:trehalose 6-phosphate synthase